VPAVAGQQRHGGEDDQALDALGMALGPEEPRRAPVVDDELDALGAGDVEEALHEARVALHGEVAVAALRAAPEAGQVGRQATGAGQEGQPVVRARRDAVEVERGAVSAGRHGRAAPEEGLAVELRAVLADLGHARGR
jgi:hypothetical protein